MWYPKRSMYRAAATFLLLILGLTTGSEDSQLQQKVLEKISLYDALKVPIERRSLVVYHAGNTTSEDSLDVLVNNVKLFVATIAQHSERSKQKAFYIFRIAGGKRSKLLSHLPAESSNVAIVRCQPLHTDLQTHIHTIGLLGDTVVSKFHAIILLSHHARGPFVDRVDGAWIQHFTKPLLANPQLALVGATLSCEVSPHVQTHAFAMRSSVAIEVFADLRPRRASTKKINPGDLEFSITSDTLNIGHKMSSLYHQRKLNTTIFDGECATGRSSCELFKQNPTSWCDLEPSELVFLRWGGPPLQLRGFHCQDTIERVREATMAIAATERPLHLVLPETIRGGPFYAINKEYDLEMWRDRSLVPYTVHALTRPEEHVEKVCFLVRSAFMQGEVNTTRAVRMDLNVFIKSLVRQSNHNWEAYFFVTDDHPFDAELEDILAKYGDIRLNYLPLDPEFRPKYDPVDAAYPASDEALRIVSRKPQCAWLSVTNGDNAYGSAVVRTVLETQRPLPNLVMLPMSSRNFDNEANLHSRLRRGNNATYGEFCIDFEQLYLKNKYGFARVPTPHIGGVDIAEVFIERAKFVAANTYFNDFNSKKVDTCAGCQDGAWVRAMVQDRNWTMHCPPITDMSTMVFHGPSPLWCVAGGNVWFDHGRKINPANACVSHKTIGALYPHKYFDWNHYFLQRSPKICLRLSDLGFANKRKPEAQFV